MPPWFVDRVAAGANLIASAAKGYTFLTSLNAATDEIPGVGEAVIIGSGVYLGGDFLYHHWSPFRNVADSSATPP